MVSSAQQQISNIAEKRANVQIRRNGERYRRNGQMITGIILSFFGASSLASLLVFAACVASSRADRIQRGAFPQTFANGEQFAVVDGQQAVATPQLSLASSTI